MKRREIIQHLTGCMFLWIAEKTEIAPAQVLNFSLFQTEALSKTSDAVQSKISHLRDEEPDSRGCFIVVINNGDKTKKLES